CLCRGKYGNHRGLSFLALPDRPAEADLAVVDAKIEAAIGIGADPGLVGDRGAVPAIVGEWNQASPRALLTHRPVLALHGSLPRDVRHLSRPECPASRTRR